MMHNVPTVTVIIPMLHAAGYISVQLDALAKQDYGGTWELILVDNGSNDRTVDIARERTRLFPVPVTHLLANDVVGSSHARNLGIRHARGELLCFCDADDRVYVNWISELVKCYKPGAVVSGYNRTWDGQELMNTNPAWCSGSNSHLGGPPIAMGCNMLVSKKDANAIGGFDSSFLTGQDADFSWRFVTAGGRILPCERALIDYREKKGIKANFVRHFNYGVDDIRLMRYHSKTFRYDRSARSYPRIKPPLVSTLTRILKQNKGAWVHAAKSWGKYLGQQVGKIHSQ